MKNSFESKPKSSSRPHAKQQTARRRLNRAEVAEILDESENPTERITRLLSRAEVALRIGVCPHTIQRLTRRGILPAIVFNRRLIRYSPDAVEAYIKAAAVGGIGEVA